MDRVPDHRAGQTEFLSMGSGAGRQARRTPDAGRLLGRGKQEHVVVLLQNCFDELRRRVPLGK